MQDGDQRERAGGEGDGCENAALQERQKAAVLRFPADGRHGSGTRSISPGEPGRALAWDNQGDVGVGLAGCP